MDFGSNPLPLWRAEALTFGADIRGPVVPARGNEVIKYAPFLAALHQGFKEVRDIRVKKGAIEIRGTSNRESLVVKGVGFC